MALRIPPSQMEAFKNLDGLSEENFQALFRALQSVQPEITSAALADRVSSLSGLDSSVVHPLVTVIGSLFLARERQGMAVDKFLNEIIAAAKRDKLVEENEERLQTLRSRLSKFLSLDHSIGVSAKATTILTRHKNVFHSAAIFSDIRPVFAGDEPPLPLGAVIIHMLEINAYTDGERKANYFALDSSDLMKLKRVIDRAVRKEKAIRETLKAVPLLEIREAEQ